jgi:hypothetical protein
VVGSFGIGALNHSGGTFSAGSLVLGNFDNGTNAASSGNYSMSNAAVLHVGDFETIGNRGIGVFTQTGGTHTIGGDLVLGRNAGSIGVYSLSADTGPSTLTVAGDETVGGVASGGWIRGGTFSQSGGVHTIGAGTSGGQLSIADSPGSTGSYSLSGGTLTASASILVGNFGQGVYDQSGGAASVTGQFGDFDVGNGPGASGSATLSDGTLSVAHQLNVGYQGTGTFSQSGGSNTARTLAIAVVPGATGTYTLSGGVLTSTNTIVGNGGVGTFIQTGGIHTPAEFFVGGSGTGRGTYSMTNGALLVTDKAFIAMLGGPGTFNQSGGTTTIANLLQVGGGTSAGVINLSGGSFSDLFTINNGTFNQSGGAADLGPLGGSNGATLVGGFGPTAQLNVTSFVQNSLTIRSNGLVTVAHNASRATNRVTTLSILGTGSLDLGNNALLVYNGATPEAIVRTYLRNAYNANGSGIGDWNGKGGITSADAIASHNGGNPDFHVSVGYVNGSYANDPLIGGSIPGQAGLATNQILIRPALYGDYNLDGSVDDTDLGIFSGLGQYNQPNPKFGWLGGDLNHDGRVDDTDLLIFSGAGNYNGPSYGAAAGPAASHASATPSLTGHAEANGDIVLSASTSQGVPGDGVLDFVYNPQTGHLTLSYDGDPRVTAAQPFQVVRFKSAGGHFIPANFNQTDFGAGVTATTGALNGTASGSNSVPDGYDMGAVLPTGLTVADLTSDLTLQWNVFGGGLTLKNSDVIVPEPGAPNLLALTSAAALAARLRRRRCASRPRAARMSGS